ncbi:hypothetical protein DSM106972_029030 [Dulcicalothrix desertica PCC 7102]|uniref:Type II secretion system protein GspC N-terminal domain-containing protein n=1 Tax=Dulcicalothrix desertica PCC 7102 TaxID=232991 RepID=A0A3S1AQ43_9CYAN|nr:hypothetical protein [Dulcicalothrix desertica]RUT06646.1 hypothetical protein DSM106972_029030 [Dulcicalothrix desertica PCC 7102]TWH50242.1 hypothetical protein CAL7102_04534 [Dulcicalothrix desertica PCC 7102]
MSTEASTHILLEEPSEDLIVSEPWSIDNYADGLMDELFADIDHILDGKSGIPVHTIEPEYVRLQTIKVPPVVIKRTEQVTVSNQQLSKVRTRKTTQNAVPKTAIKHRKPRRWLTKVFSLAATVGVAAVAMVCINNSGLLNRLVSRSFQQSLMAPNETAITEVDQVADVQTDLVNYMLGALAAIDRQDIKLSNREAKSAYMAVANPQPIAMAGTPAGQLPPPMAANNTAPTNGRSTTVVERIYIPVYQAPLPMRYAPPQIPGVRGTLPPVPTQPQSQARALPQTPSVKTALNNVGKKLNNATKPLNVFAAVRPALKPLTIARTPININPPKAPSVNLSAFRAIPPQLPTAKPKAQTNTETVRPAQPQPLEVAVAPTNPISHTLEGLLELGDKSAALFKVNGVTRRIEIGEAIGASGWTLVEVTNGEAVIRRNGEVRSIYAGQNF